MNNFKIKRIENIVLEEVIPHPKNAENFGQNEWGVIRIILIKIIKNSFKNV